MSPILSVWPEGNNALWIPPIESHWGSLMASVRFVRVDHGVGLIVRWSCDSANTGRTEQAFETCEPFWSTADLANHMADVAARNLSMVMDVPAYEARMLATLAGYANANVEWVADYVKATGVEIPHEAAMAASAAASPAKTAQSEAKAKVARKRAARLAEKTESEVAAESSPSPVKCVEPVSKSVELPSKCVELRTTHFRGVLLRDASDWDDPSAEGVFVGVPNERYHACPSLSGTGAAAYAKSAAHGIIDKVIPARSRDLGILVHGDALEGKDAAALGFAVVPGKTTTKEGCVTEDMVRLSRNCCDALRADANTAGVLAAQGLRELSCRVRCPETGAMLRCRFDLAPEAGAWAWDVKTTSADGPDAFDGSFGEFGYAVTAAHYLRVAALVGLPFRAMAYACVSTEEPHEVWVAKFGPLEDCAEAFALANAAAITSASRYVHGKATGEFPKRTHTPRVARLKPWHLEALRSAATTEIPY